jgi:hypothetical protein
MKPCWKDAGLTPEGAKIADVALAPMTVALELAGTRELAKAVLNEAFFRRFDLPTKPERYRKNYMKKNGEK